MIGISPVTEFEFIQRISKGVPRSGDFLIQGIDDDAAVVEGPGSFHWLVTTDLLAEGVHFRREWSDFTTLGKKALLVNLSDIAAMGGAPRFYFVSIGIPQDINSGDGEAIFDGMRGVASSHDMILAGGDTSSSRRGLFISVTVMGLVEKGAVIYRKGARPGDRIFVSGSLGSAAAGLVCLEKGLEKEGSLLVQKHLLPEPRLKLAALLSKNKLASSMIDVSDGLKADLDHLADSSGVGYRLYYERIPKEEGIARVSEAVSLVLAGGEDYELLFTMSEEQEKRFLQIGSEAEAGCRVTPIGDIIPSGSGRLILDKNNKEIKPEKSGFVHFLR